MRVEHLIVIPCQSCGNQAVVRQFGWDVDNGGFVCLYQCPRCQHLDWFAMDIPDMAEETPEKKEGMDNGYL